MNDDLFVRILLVCTATGLLLRFKRKPVSAGHIGLILLLTIAIFAIPTRFYMSQTTGRRTSPRNACINNLRRIDGAKEQWALENHIESGALAIPKEVNAYIKGGGPKCPDGGSYTYGKVDEPPRCSIKEHTLK